MLKKIFSMKIAVILMLIFAISIGVATFIENDYGTQTARALIYNAKWFEFLLFYFSATILYNIFAFKMYKRSKWPQLTLHIGFLFVAVGALVTRYIGYEGILHIRENATKDYIVSDTMNLTVAARKSDSNESTLLYQEPIFLSSLGENSFKKSFKYDNQEIKVELLKYFPSLSKEVVEDKNGDEILKLRVSKRGVKGEDYFLKKGTILDFGDYRLNFSSKDIKDGDILIKKENNKLFFKAPFDVDYFVMQSGESGKLPKDKWHELQLKRLYQFNGNSIVFASIKRGKIKEISPSLKPLQNKPQVARFKVSVGNESKIVELEGFRGAFGEPKVITLNNYDIYLRYGAKVYKLPFKVKLNDFEIERYPGSMSPSSYSSWVEIDDKEMNKKFKYHIYMNHVLDYRGYRFFQSSYDMDEKGSVLSVNHDPGTLITYIGYILLSIGFFWGYFSKNGRIAQLRRKLEKLKGVGAISIVALFLGANSLYGAKVDISALNKEELKILHGIDQKHADNFARVIVQDSSGRMKPMDTLSREILHKIARKNDIDGVDPNQFHILMLVYPTITQKIKFIKVNHPAIMKMLGLPKDSKYASYNDFFDNNGNYKLQSRVLEASRKRSALRGKLDKELIKVDERVNILYMIYKYDLFRVFPKPQDPNNRWYSPIKAMSAFKGKEGKMVGLITMSYFKSVIDGVKSGNWKKANEAIDVIKKYQHFYGSKVIPSKKRVEMEILYNKLNIFSRLTLVYILVGLFLLVIAFIKILKPNREFRGVTKAALYILYLAFVAHTLGLILRWYIADHAPWSNAYESIIYISWATVLAGFVFARKSPITLAATSILGGIFLFVAHLNWLDPQITNLVPVLKSYWLMIHVAVITASYGFLGLGALLGFITLILMIIQKRSSNSNIPKAIKELTIINEITLLIGLGLITIGNFLGAVWANESWGRYWSWDPKETWAAVTILVYAAIVHMRYIPKLNDIYIFNVAALLGYSSVIMTYFGVNYYLSGLHSYAAGDPVPIPSWVYPAIGVIFIIILLAYPPKGKRYRL